MPATRSPLHRAPLGVAATITLVATLGIAAPAQRNPEVVPTVLATALLGGFAGELGVAPRFVVDREPAGWPRALHPGAPWKVVGGVEVGPIVIAVFGAPHGADANAGLATLPERAGLRPFSAPPTTGGFAPAVPPKIYCDDSTFVTIATVDSTASTRFVALSRLGRGGRSGCSQAAGGEPSTPLVIPPLRPPSGVAVRRGGTAFGGDYVEASAQLDTTMSVPAILDHYAAVLRAAGWTVGGQRMSDGGSGLQRISVRDKTGTEWQGALIVVSAGARRQLTLRMLRPGALD
jgi:hypothetical protein